MNEVSLDSLATREAIQKLEAFMLTKDCTTNFDQYLTHYYAHGVYVREMRIPVDTIITGKMHKYDEINVLTKGIILVKAEGFSESVVYEAPYTFITAPGKKVLYILEDAIFLNIHPNPSNTTDLSVLETELITPERPVLEVVL